MRNSKLPTLASVGVRQHGFAVVALAVFALRRMLGVAGGTLTIKCLQILLPTLCAWVGLSVLTVAQAGTATFTSSGTWTAPAGVTSISVDAWGGGGGGGGQNLTSDGGGGGGGGAYSRAASVAVTPGNTYTVTVGAGGVAVVGGTGGSGGDSFFNNTSTVLAKGGAGGPPSTGAPPAGGLGGAAALGVGTTKFSGGNGGRGRDNGTGRGGPGGSSAGTAANGTAGPDPWSTLTAGAAPAGGGIGGNGGDVGVDGFTPASGYGGGGGGSGDGLVKRGGAGAPGVVVISYVDLPVVTTVAATTMAATSVTLNGSVTSDSNASTTVTFDYGPTLAYGSTITATPSPVAAGATNTVSAALTGLNCSTTYNFRVKGLNSAGTANGSNAVFTTLACSAPTVSTTAASGVIADGATLNGTVTSNGASTTVSFDYGLTTAYGTNVAATPNLLAASAPSTGVSATVSGLSCNQTYQFRANGVNSFGTTNGANQTFTTAACPTLTEFNASGGTTSTDGLHFYLENTTKIQVRRLNNTGQVYLSTAVPPSNSLDNGVFIRANGLVYGPSHTVGGGFNPPGGMYNTYSITPAAPANPSSDGIQQSANGTFGITSGPQVSVVWKYTTPLDFLTAEVTLTIPGGYAVSAANPVRYYHVFDTFLGGSDNGCGTSYIDTNGKRVMGTYQPTTGGCTTTTGIPAGINVVESFRERSGLPFSSYCASGWQSFFVNGSTNCSVLQNAVMSNALAPTLIDTGIGVEYDFTSPGTYTFSYDFVIGSPNVPPYDHLEIRHDGAATLCPENVTVLACTSSTVPCPAGSFVNSGTLTGNLTTTPGSPVITQTPSSITLGASGSTQTITLQAAGGGPVTLGTTGLSTTPLNGTKCWNTATLSQSCSMNVVNTPCVSGYECLETGVTYNNLVTTPAARNPLYTKLSGTDFKFDVVAQQSSGAVATSYTAAANVTVELFDDSASPAPTCSAYASPLASQAITFASGDNGRKTVSANFNLANAYGKLRCRVKDTNLSPTVFGCSSDNFAVRPQQFTVTAPAMGNTGLTGTPKAVAGSAFTLTAGAGVAAGYAGTPTLDTSKVNDHLNTAIASGTLSGTFAAGTGSSASGAAFKYLDVGSLKLLANAVLDSGFTVVDQTNDCVAGSTSNTLSGGKYGCNIGSAASATMGRWYPSHYSFAGTLTPACGTGGFTYMDQDALGVSLMLKAHASGAGAASASDPVVSRYTTGYTNLAPVTITGDNGGTAVALARLVSPAFLAMPSAALWNAGVFQINDTYAFSKLASPDGPYDSFRLNAALTDPDGSSLIAAPAPQTNASKIRYGRIQLQNAYGSEYLGLPVPLAIQYWNGNWQKNTLDTCTSIQASQFAWSFPAGSVSRPNSLTACKSAATLTGVSPNYVVTLSAPGAGNAGWADLTLNLGATAVGNTCTAANAGSGFTAPASTANAPWLQFNWMGTVSDPKVRTTFGIYKSPLIYRRENY